MRPAFALMALLAACAPPAPPPAPADAREQACAQHVDDDPAVRDAIAKSSSPDWLWQNEGKVEIIKQQAIARCVQGRGGVVRGGVERPR